MEGNRMKMRDALIEIEKMAHCDLGNVYPKYRNKFDNLVGGIERIARAALSAPARNCDVGTPEEQAERFRAFCNKGKLPQFAESAYCAHECSCRDAADCKFAWAQTPYEADYALAHNAPRPRQEDLFGGAL